MADNFPPQPRRTGDAILMASLLDLNSHRFADLCRSLVADLRLQHHRLISLLLSPERFSYVLAHLRSLSFSDKTTLLARFLLRTLHHFALAVDPNTLRSTAGATGLRDLDAAVLLMAMCDAYEEDEDGEEEEEEEGRCKPGTDKEWRERIKDHLLSELLSPAGLGVGAAFGMSVGVAAKCRRFLAAVVGEEKAAREVGAAVAAVVSLDSVGCEDGKECCAICWEKMEAWRDVCGMPCGHKFHWACILPWLRRRSTCPCCRFELPSDDAFCEIRRLWRVVEGRQARSSVGGDGVFAHSPSTFA